MTTKPTPCPGRCNVAWRKAEQKLAAFGTPHELKVRWGAPLHCGPCTSGTRQHLSELPELVAAIHLEAANATRRMGIGTVGRVAGGIPAWPGQASRLLTDLIIGGLGELEDDVRELRHLTARPGRGNEGAIITDTVRFLTAHLDWIMSNHPCAGEVHDVGSANPSAQVATWHRAAERFTQRDVRLEHHRVPCPRCDLLTLFRAPGENYIECRNPVCGNLLTSGEYLDHTRRLAAAYRDSVAA